MSVNAQGYALDLSIPTVTPIAVVGATGTTPVVSSSIRVTGALTVNVTIATTSTLVSTLTYQTSEDNVTWATAIALTDDAVNVVSIPMSANYLRFTFTRVSGAGDATFTLGIIHSRPVDMEQITTASLQLRSPATAAGTWGLGCSNTYSEGMGEGIPLGQATFPQYGTTAPTAATAGQDLAVSLGDPAPFKFRALQVDYTPTSGAGIVQAAYFGRGQ